MTAFELVFIVLVDEWIPTGIHSSTFFAELPASLIRFIPPEFQTSPVVLVRPSAPANQGGGEPSPNLFANVVASDSSWLLCTVAGGANRDASIHAALVEIEARFAADDPLVVIQGATHGGPGQALVSRIVAESRSREGRAVVCAAPVTETIKETDPDGWIVGTIDRGALWHAQLPQVCRLSELRKFHRTCPPDGHRNLASLVGSAPVLLTLVAEPNDRA